MPILSNFPEMAAETPISSSMLEKLSKSQSVVLQMLRDRKYPLDEKDTVAAMGKFDSIYRDMSEKDVRLGMKLICDRPRKDHSKILVIWSLRDKLGTNLQDIHKEMEEIKAYWAIVVVNNEATYLAKAYIRNLRKLKTKIMVQVFSLDETQFNVSQHELVPKHSVCSLKEKKRVLAELGVTAKQMSKIPTTDPQVRYLGARPGTMILIERKSETYPGYLSILYRIVG